MKECRSFSSTLIVCEPKEIWWQLHSRSCGRREDFFCSVICRQLTIRGRNGTIISIDIRRFFTIFFLVFVSYFLLHDPFACCNIYSMKFVRLVSFLTHRRRRKQHIFIILLLLFITFSSMHFDYFKIDSVKNIEESKNEFLANRHPIFSKYIKDPYDINVWKIIHEANENYQNNQKKYLVYSCRFMCGGKVYHTDFVFTRID